MIRSPVGCSTLTEVISRAGSSRLTLGLLLDWLEGEYQNGIFSGAAEAARENDVNLVCFTGGVLRAPRWFWAERNSAFDLVGRENVDGLIVTSTIANAVGTEMLVEYCRRFRSIPLCSIAVPMPDVPGLTVDQNSGFADGLRHLIDVHGRKRIAFIRGPEASEEAQRRFVAFQEVLAAADLPVVPELLTVGDFLRATGATAVRRWADTGVQFDAIVAANDEMALGALDVLLKLGVRVPQDVSVMGFDDSEESRFCSPALTTVRQPVRELGRRAVLMVLEQLRHGGRIPESQQLGSTFVPRASCGCSRRAHAESTAATGESDGGEGVSEGLKCVQLQRWVRSFAEASKAFLVTLDMPSLMNAIIDQLPRLQIPSCYLALYENREAPAESARMLLACDALTPGRRWPWLQQPEGGGDGGRRFLSRELIPADLWPSRRTTFVLEPLFYRDEQQGYVLIEMGPSDGAAYEALRDQISGALKGAMQYQRVADERDRRHAMEKAEVDVEKERLIAAGIQGLLPRRELRSGDLDVATAILPAPHPRGGAGDAIETATGLHAWVARTEMDSLTGALTAFMMQSVILARVTQDEDVQPAEVIETVRRVMARRAPSGGAVNAIMTAVCIRDGRLTVAGDPAPVLLCRRNGRCELLAVAESGDASSLPALEDGDVLVLAIGVAEALGAQSQAFGRERLARSIAELRRESARGIRDGLLAVLKRWTSAQREDLVIVVVRRHA